MEKTSQKVFVMWFCFCIMDAVAGMGCRWEERQALLRFRERLVDPDNWLSTVWVGDDCCNWGRVGCCNETGHVLKLDLIYRLDPGETRGPLSGEIDPSLMDLKHLQYLDLGYNVFNGTIIPQFFGSMTSLRYLSLSNTRVTGTIPTQLGNLTNLRYLDLSFTVSLRADTLQWLANLSSLQYLDLSWVYLADATDWPLVFYSLPSLSVLRLSNCGLSAAIPSYQPNQNLTSISILDLSKNYIFSSTIPDWLFNISSLTELDLHNCNISDPIPNNIGNLSSLSVLNLNINNLEGFIPWNIGYLCNLKDLDLSYNKIVSLELLGCARYSLEELNLMKNKLTGTLPDWLGNSRNLRYLNLGYNLLSGPIPPSLGSLSFLRKLILYGNNLNGSIPESLGQLSELVVLDLRFNSLEGVVSDAHFAKHAMLEALFLSYNPLSLTLSSNWVPPFQLKNIHLGSCLMGPGFPSWLRTQREFSTLDISDAGISDQVPNWFWNLSSRIFLLNVSYNGITGELPSSLEHFSAAFIDLSSNGFHGPLPPMNTSLQALYASNNSFSGDLHAILKETMQSLQVVLLSGNSLHGSIPSSLCEMKGLHIIDLSNNLLSGEIPICQRVLYNWDVLNLASNNLQGPIPDWMGSLQMLRSLHLSDNSLHGDLPLSLQNCKHLIILDLGENKLTGRIPTWIGEQLSYLLFLRLRSNMFDGSIPPELAYLASLQILDLAHNCLSGSIPLSFKNLSAVSKASKMMDILPFGAAYIDSDYEVFGLAAIYTVALSVATKGREFEYSHTLSLVMSIDLSENLLSGEVPEELMDLVGLQSLNLSGNQLTGKIPDKIGDMIWLETLDLSRNQLTGTIPWSITALTLLNHMNLSYNNLSGQIPSGNQLQTLTDPSIYESNDGLCGFPLSNTCPGAQPSDDPILSDGEDFDNGSESIEFYISVGLGFLVGLCGVFGVLFIKESWTTAYFELIDDITGPIYMAVAMKLKRRF